MTIISQYIRDSHLKSINLSAVKWSKVAESLATKSVQQCRNKAVQILQLLFRDNSALDHQLVRYLMGHSNS